MADFMDFEAEESENEEDMEYMEKKRAKKSRAMVESDEEEDDDGEEVKDLIDDNPIEEEESDGEDSDGSDGSKKRKKRSEEDFDDRLEDDDYDLLEENLGVAVERKRFKRLKRVQDPESDEEEEQVGDERDAIANELFDGGSGDEDERQSVRSHRREAINETLNDEESEGEESDVDDFIVDDDGNPIAPKKPKRKARFADAALQEAQDIFGVDFDYGEFGKYDEEGEDLEEDDEEEPDEYADEDGEGERVRRPKKTPKKRQTRRTIFEIYEPSELKRGHFTDIDNEIRNADIPERMQLRSVPVTSVPEGSDELDLEAEWIYNQAFCKPTISIQDAHLSDEAKERARKGPQTVSKIKNALDFMRNQHFEVPFISFYRKEYVLPELNINDLWKVYKYDAKWCQLRQRKENLLKLFEKMRDYQLDEIMKNPNAPLPDNVRVIKDEDIDRLKNVQTTEELNDVHRHFMLYYSHDLPNMQEAVRLKEKEARRQERIAKRKQQIEEAEENGEEPPPEDQIDAEEEEESDEILKQAVRTGPYAMCRKAGLDSFAKKFGLTPEHFAENLRDNYQRHEVDQEPVEPSTIASDYLGEKFKATEEVVKAAQLMVAYQLAREPLVRKCVREMYMERAKLTVRPTQKGIKVIDENHAIYTMKYLKNKPVRDLVGDQWLKLTLAEEEKLITISLSDVIEGNTTSNYVDEIKQLYYRDEFSKNVQDWNALRVGSVELALTRMIIPDLKKELQANLANESKEFVLRACCRKMYNWIKDGPYVASPEFDEDEDEEWETKKGIRVMGVAYVPDLSQAAFACLIAPDGECTDYLRLPHLLKRKNGFRQDEKIMKAADLLAIRNFIAEKKPHVIAVGGESREAVMVAEDLREIITSLTEEEDLPPVKVEICDNELAKLFANSNKGSSEFRDYPVILREAISLARRLQDPLVEFTQLCTSDEEILCLKYHIYQDQLPKEDLLENLYLEFVNRVNEVGVDFNKALQQPYFENLVQFTCGLGPRKAQTLIKMMKQTNQRLENRTQLVTACHMGPKVFINCAGFIKIDTNSLGDSTEAYVEVLDGSRVHPETYEWARKMAVDALEYDDEEANPAGALEEILESPERLKDLDLDAFAEELERQGFGNKCVTLYDIRAELNSRYKDLRAPYQSLSPEKLFDVLTKETPETFYIGKLMLATVSGINHRKPQGDQLDQANPVRNDVTGFWQCPFCLQTDFPELCEVWNHFDTGGCPGKATGVKLRLDNGVSGYIHIKNVSDKRVENLHERVHTGQTIHCRIIKIEVERFSVECTSKSSDLLDVNHQMRPQRDPFYDTEAEEKDSKVKEDAKKVQQRQTYLKRVIVHPCFHNITYSEAEKLMKSMKQGEAIVRPSSKGADRLTVTWKVTDEILHHIDVTEEEKANSFSLGKSLVIGNEKFEDLDEVIARHVNPMGQFASELMDYKYYKTNIDGCKEKANALLKAEQKMNPKSIPYIVSASKSRPGKFLLSYLPRRECKHEYISVSPDGFGYRGRTFVTVDNLFRWFKKHYRDPIPVQCTPRSTPGIGNGISEEAINRVAKNLPSHMVHSLSQVTNQTPRHYPPLTPGSVIAAGYGTHTYPNTPYTPSGQTPFMTPYQTPHHTPHHAQPTPKYGQPIPVQHDGQFLLPAPPPSTGIHYRSTRPTPVAGSMGGLTDLSKAAAAWAQLSAKSNSTRVSNTTPKYDERNTTPRYDDPRKTPRAYENSSSREKQRSKGSARTPSQRSPRESPRNNSSKLSANGDKTPLWDEGENWD